MGFSDFTTTAAGQEMIAEAVTAGQLKLTKIQLGSGRITSQALAGMAELIEPVLDVAIASKEVKRGIAKDGSTANYALIQGHFKTTQLQKGFYFREIGVFARIDDGEERLFLYNNAYDLADYIDNTVKETQDRTLVIPVFVGSVKEVELELSMDLTYVTNDEFREHEEDTEAHLPPGGKEGQILTKGKTKAEWKDQENFPDFDNLLMWPGCIKASLPPDGNTWIERIMTKADRLLRAEKITVRTEAECVETFRFYYADGITLKGIYIVHTWQEDGIWYEEITKEGIEELFEVYVEDECLVINMSGDPIQGEGLLLNIDGCTVEDEGLIFDPGGASFEDDTATDEEVEEMLDKIFGKDDAEDSESDSGDSSGSAFEGESGVVATDEEVEEMLGNVFGAEIRCEVFGKEVMPLG